MLETDHFVDPSGDVFVKTQPDQSVFQISSALLSLVSNVFADMIADGAESIPPTGKSSERPISLEQDGDIFNAICQIIYPGENPPLHEDLPLLVKCITFAERYELDTLIPVFQEMLCHPYLLDAQPFHVYGLACDFGWPEVKDRAAKATLIHDVDSIRLVPGFGKLSAQDYHELVTLHRLKAEKMKSIIRILDNSRYLAAGVKCIPSESFSDEVDYQIIKEKSRAPGVVGGLKPSIKASPRSIPKGTKITIVGPAKRLDPAISYGTGKPSPAPAEDQVPESCQIEVSHFWESKRCKCNPQPLSVDVADTDYDSITPQWLQHFLSEASYALLPMPTVEKLNKVFAHNPGVRSALNTLCPACPVNAREHSGELMRYKVEMMKAFNVE